MNLSFFDFSGMCAFAGVALAIRARRGLRLGEGWGPWMRFQSALTLLVPTSLPVMLMVIAHGETGLLHPSRSPPKFLPVEAMLFFGFVLLVSASVVFHRASRLRTSDRTSV